MFRIYFTALLSIWLLTGCKGTKTPPEFYQEIVAINDSIKAYGADWGTAFGQSIMSRDFSALKPVRQKIEDHIAESIEVVSGMKGPEGSEALKEVELEYLEYEQKMVHESFTPFEGFNAATTNAEIQLAANGLAMASDEEAGKVSRMQAAMKEFARIHSVAGK